MGASSATQEEARARIAFIAPLADGLARTDPNYGQLVRDAETVAAAAERAEEALVEIGAILMLPTDADTKLERIRQRIAEGLNDG